MPPALPGAEGTRLRAPNSNANEAEKNERERQRQDVRPDVRVGRHQYASKQPQLLERNVHRTVQIT